MEKRLLALALALVMVFSLLPAAAFADTYSGSCGDNVSWKLDTSTGVLTISGSGTMKNYSDDGRRPPWYKYCYDISTVIIKNGVTSIGYYTFASCSDLTRVTIPNSVTSIGNDAFSVCESLTSITLPSSVKKIGDCAFEGCHSLKSITIPSLVTSIGERAFTACESLTSIKVSSNNTSYSSSNGVLFNKDKTVLVCYPGGKSGSYTIPSTVNCIGSLSFAHCYNLTGIIIPSSVTSIGDEAFYGCTDLSDVYYLGSASEWNNIDIEINNAELTDTTLHYCTVSSVTEPTYSEKGYTTYKCSTCGKKIKSDFTSVLSMDNPVITATRTANSVKLTWNAVEGATGYVIQRRAATGTNWSDLATTTNLSYTNSDITSGNAYSYRVVAYAGDVDTNSSVSKYKTAYVGQVTGLSLTQQKKGVKVSWSKLKNASGYKVYRKVSSGDWKLIKTITSGSTLSYTDTAATNTKRNYYKIVAYRTISDVKYSAVESASKNLIYVAAPSLSSATNSGSGKITVKWTKNSSATGYRVKVMGTKLCSFYTITSPSTLSKVITGKSKDTYKIYVQAYKIVNDKKYYSEWSSYKTVKVTK